MALIIQLTILAASAVIFTLLKKILLNRNLPPLPPSPKGWPLIGNLFDLCPDGQHPGKFYQEHKKRYGPLSSLMVVGQPLIVVNDRETAAQLFEKSAKHSSRPHSVFADELCGYEKSIPRQDNDHSLRAHRRALAKVIGTNTTAARFDHQLEEEFCRLMWRILDKPDELFDHCKITAGSFALRITYGYNVEPHKSDYLVDLAEVVLLQFAEAIMPGRFLVDIFPAMKHFPSWVPGTSYKKRAQDFQECINKLVDYPYEFTKWQMKHSVNEPSVVSACIKNGEDNDVTKWAAGAIYGAGVDTTVAVLESFFLAMMVYPDVKRKAQAEIDQVVGEDRFPVVADRPNLPYINAMVKESLRWHTVALMTPRKTDEDEVINGFLIPKGSTILANLWAMNNDPDVYPEPNEFRPERYLASDTQNIAPDPTDNTFGFGRRVCPGRITAETSIFLGISNALFSFDIEKPIGNDGQVIEPEVKFSSDFISHPLPFKCSLKPRSESRRDLILNFEREHPFPSSDAGKLTEAVKEAGLE